MKNTTQQFFSAFGNHRRLAVVLSLISVLIGFVGIVHHEMWRDETEAWMIARDSANLSTLVDNMRYQGHPMFWHLLLFAISRFTHNMLFMQGLHVLILAGAVYVFVRYSPFSTGVKIMLPFSYYFIFEYLVVSRNYGLAVLMLFLFAHYFTREKWLLAALFLGLVGQCNAVALVVSGSLAFYFWVVPLLKNGFKPMVWKPLLAPFILYSFITLVAIYYLIPAPDCVTTQNHGKVPFSWDRVGNALVSWPYSFVDIPKLNVVSNWNSRILDTFFVSMVLGIIVTLFTLLVVIKDTFLRISWVLSLLLFVFFQFMIYPSLAARHTGLFFMIWLVFLWLNEKTRPTSHSRLYTTGLFVFLSCQLMAGVLLYTTDFRHDFSGSKNMAAYITEKQLNTKVLAGYWDFSASTQAAYLDRPIFYPERNSSGTFMIWNTAKKWSLPTEELENLLISHMAQQQADTLYLITHEPKVAFNRLNALLLHSTPPCMVDREQLHLFQMTVK